ncbi:MAG: SDR family oxidoreductase [Rhodobacteraceae bacterium]|nr:SDR family oxidoreductase [Paracoccaceae bacterium]
MTQQITPNRASFPDLDGAAVFITGGGSGIGAALTRGFARQGARVAFCDIADSTELAEDIKSETGLLPLFVSCDITKTEDLQASIDQAVASHGPLAALVNNAANDMRRAADAVDEAFWDEMSAVNIKAQFFAAQRAAVSMKTRGGGSIINYSSISHVMGLPDLSTYIASKAGVTGMTRSLAREWGPDGIRVNAIAPGWVLTPKQKEVWATPEGIEKHRAMQSLKELIMPEDMVAPTLFLASDASRMMTGQVMTVDAGVVAGA